MKTTAKIVPIGNPKGIRLPKKMLDELELSEVVQIESRGNELIIRSTRQAHAGRKESAKELRERSGDAMLLGNVPASEWNNLEWKWQNDLMSGSRHLTHSSVLHVTVDPRIAAPAKPTYPTKIYSE